MWASTLPERDRERLQRGVEGLASGAYIITLTRFTEDDINGYVSNGDGKRYSVTLTVMRSFCGCSDNMFRVKTCEHSVTLALYVIRTPEIERAIVAPTPELTLAKTRPGAFSA